MAVVSVVGVEHQFLAEDPDRGEISVEVVDGGVQHGAVERNRARDVAHDQVDAELGELSAVVGGGHPRLALPLLRHGPLLLTEVLQSRISIARC